jgi:hypothetical protein
LTIAGQGRSATVNTAALMTGNSGFAPAFNLASAGS